MLAVFTASLAMVASATLSAAGPIHERQSFTPSAWDTWIWNNQSTNVCADGSMTGFAYNMHSGANDILIYFDGGGACWDTNSCFTNPTAFNLQGYTESSFQGWTKTSLDSQILLTSRDPARNNPWAGAHYVFVPYCTGDIHGGNNVVTYDGAPAPIYHKGYSNFQTILQVVAGAVPYPQNVWITGTSAGCFGATLNYVAARKAFPWSRIHLIGDSCETTPGFIGTKPSWKLTQPGGRDCPKCQPGEFNSFLPALSSANTGSRFGSISFASDGTLPGFMGATMDSFTSIISGYFANVTKTTTNMAKTFTVTGEGHGVLYQTSPVSTTGATLASWLATMKNLRSGSAYKSV
ncbi:Protein notum [Kalmanozyma brasiliensis GHG001]|uniref:Pectinacetylesterase n=1 Tax=Kalmanozyma brasiliensis (strain GHG001) TaxID=1365824 RepID=V5GUP3_KALBG|nr:Protein notum [Kalmanozyma brasiliensis GHG001]EST09612.1 Protein notum [Kalmanozyma brasiliensis GHG001]